MIAPETPVIPVIPVTKEEDEPKKNQADRMLGYLFDDSKYEITLFTDQRGLGHIQILDIYTDVTSIHRLKEKFVRLLLIGEIYDNEEKAPNDAAIKSAINVLLAKAIKGPIIPLFNRVAQDGETIWLDMCNDTWDAIRIKKDGWSITRPPIIFRRYNSQNPLPTPSKNGSLKPLLKILKFDNLGDQLLFVVNTITNIIPGIAHMVSMVHGPQGGGKSLLQKTQKMLVDPAKILAYASIPKDKKEFIRILEQNYIMVFDNVSYLSSSSSDIFCSAVTGAGQDFRELYTDFDSIIYEFRRCLCLNGISVPGTSPDLLDRSGIYRQHVKTDDLWTEKMMDEYLEKNTPIILGGMLDALVKAINYYPEMEKTVKFKHRLTDFTIWGCAVTKALGLDHNLFLDSFFTNINNQKVEALNSSPIVDCIRHFLQVQQGTLLGGEWSGSATQLFEKVKSAAKDLNISTSQKAFPKSPPALGIALAKLEPNFPVMGYIVERDRTGAKRTISFLKTKKQENFFKPVDWGLGPDLENYLELDMSSPYKPEDEQEKKVPVRVIPLPKGFDPMKKVEIKESKTPSLKISINRVLDSLRKAQKISEDGAVREEDFYKFQEAEGNPRQFTERIIGVLLRDGTIYRPLPMFLKTVEDG